MKVNIIRGGIKMKREFKGFIVGVIITVMLMSTVALAGGVKQKIEVMLNSVNLAVNGKSVKADNILYKGTTYVPLRAVAEMLGKDVGWDQKTNTASINDKVEETPVTKEKNPVKNSDETLSQKNAVNKAKNYLDYTAFSKSGLIKQLKFEGFSEEDATYAVNQINVNWKEQAVNKAKSYLEHSSFSRSGLIEQLEFEGFSEEEATYAVDKVGL